MSDEKTQAKVSRLGSVGVGTIDPDLRVKTGEIDDQKIDEIATNIDEYYVPIDSSLAGMTMLIPKWCVDGREDVESAPLAPNASGGTYSLVAADALIDAPALISAETTSAEHGTDIFKSLLELGYDVGGHCADHAEGENAGCGACDKFGEIFGYIAKNVTDLSIVAAGLGVTVPEELQAKIARNAEDLLNAGYVSNGKDMIDAIRGTAGEEHVQTLIGGHNEVLLIVNAVENTTLDRRGLARQYGEKYQAFNLDTWALKNGIEAISTVEQEKQEKFVASVLYNIATAAVLAGPSLRVVVR